MTPSPTYMSVTPVSQSESPEDGDYSFVARTSDRNGSGELVTLSQSTVYAPNHSSDGPSILVPSTLVGEGSTVPVHDEGPLSVGLGASWVILSVKEWERNTAHNQ